MRICITGASRGIGLALCTELLNRGHEVWGISRNKISLPVDQKNFHASVVDVTDAQSIRSWKEEMDRAGWHPDIIILNAGTQQEDMFDDRYSFDEGQKNLRVNLEGPLACVDAFLQDFLRRGSGSFVAITSTSAIRPSPRSAAYSASKAGLAMALRSLGLRYRKTGIRFKTVFLGPVATAMWEGKKTLLVPSSEKAAETLATFVCSEKSILWYPRFSTLLLRLSLFLPDWIFSGVSEKLLR